LYADVAHEPLGDLWLPLADGTVARRDTGVRPEMLDLDRLAGPQLQPGPRVTEGDLFGVVQPFARVPWVEAILGCPIRATIAGGSMRTEAGISGWEEWARLSQQPQRDWLDLLVQLTRTLSARVAGRLAVAPTLMRGPCDLAEAVLGPELMCFSIYDHPSDLAAFLSTATAVFVEALRAQLQEIDTVAGGYVNPFGIWAPGTVVRTQCDASAILSPEHYADWFLPWDVEICQAADFSIIHLHSVSLHTVDPLLHVRLPHAIQVTLETTHGAPTIAEMIPTFRKVLESKCLVVDGQVSSGELELLRSELPQDGLCVINRRSAW
jgi:hypothetical protein